ncbi:hypothetical protein [Raineyella sp. LH-20]|uniref:hypothetical protein n=1 Tax=Raineyella sp. LH-20 TaxID=3081204 RepID=UPI0029554CCA|nr:hypothetical protein [Raineyella sp. LH-20]WOP19292.1 hypothetical protein R0146_03200 [Raineyella sp. LH-20]
MSTISQRPQRTAPSPASRGGYGGVVLVVAVLLYLMNVSPGWRVVPILTSETSLVLGSVNAALGVVLLANLLYLVVDSRPVRGLGGLATSGVSMIALFRIWEVFPFHFADTGFDWVVLTRVLLVAAIVGTVVGLVASGAMMLGGPWGSRRPTRRDDE